MTAHYIGHFGRLAVVYTPLLNDVPSDQHAQVTHNAGRREELNNQLLRTNQDLELKYSFQERASTG